MSGPKIERFLSFTFVFVLLAVGSNATGNGQELEGALNRSIAKPYALSGSIGRRIFDFHRNGVKVDIRIVPRSSTPEVNETELEDRFPEFPVKDIGRCLVDLSFACAKNRLRRFLETVRALDKITLWGEDVKLVKMRTGRGEGGRGNDTGSIQRSVDDFFDAFALRITLPRWNRKGEKNQIDVMLEESEDGTVEGRGKKGGGGGGGGKGGGKGGGGGGGKCKMMMMAMVMMMKMKLLGVMAMKGMMMAGMSLMISTVMLTMKFMKGGGGGGFNHGGGGGGGGGGGAGGLKEIILVTKSGGGGGGGGNGGGSSGCCGGGGNGGGSGNCCGGSPSDGYGAPTSSYGVPSGGGWGRSFGKRHSPQFDVESNILAPLILDDSKKSNESLSRREDGNLKENLSRDGFQGQNASRKERVQESLTGRSGGENASVQSLLGQNGRQSENLNKSVNVQQDLNASGYQRLNVDRYDDVQESLLNRDGHQKQNLDQYESTRRGVMNLNARQNLNVNLKGDVKGSLQQNFYQNDDNDNVQRTQDPNRFFQSQNLNQNVRQNENPRLTQNIHQNQNQKTRQNQNAYVIYAKYPSADSGAYIENSESKPTYNMNTIVKTHANYPDSDYNSYNENIAKYPSADSGTYIENSGSKLAYNMRIDKTHSNYPDSAFNPNNENIAKYPSADSAAYIENLESKPTYNVHAVDKTQENYSNSVFNSYSDNIAKYPSADSGSYIENSGSKPAYNVHIDETRSNYPNSAFISYNENIAKYPSTDSESYIENSGSNPAYNSQNIGTKTINDLNTIHSHYPGANLNAYTGSVESRTNEESNFLNVVDTGNQRVADILTAPLATSSKPEVSSDTSVLRPIYAENWRTISNLHRRADRKEVDSRNESFHDDDDALRGI